MSKYLIRKIKADDEFIDIYAQAEAEDVKFFIDKGNNRYEESTVQAVLEQIGADIKEIKENMNFISGGGSTVIQPVSFGGTGADNTVQASLNLKTAYLGEIPYGIEAMAFLTEETIDNNNPPGTYRYVNFADLGEVPVFIQPVDILTGEEIGLPFVEEIRAYSEGIITVDEGTYAVEDYDLVAEVQIPFTVYTTEITVKIPYKRVFNLTYTVYWYGETGLDTGEYELLKQETRGGAGFEADQTVSVTDFDKVIEGYYEFDEENSENILSTVLSGESNNVLKLYFRATPEPVYSSYTVKMFNSATGEELIGDFTGLNVLGFEQTMTYPLVVTDIETGVTIEIPVILTLDSETRTYNYKEDDERNVTTLTIVEDPEANIFKLYYEMVPVYADVNVEFINVITSEEITGTFDKCRIYDYTSIPESLGEISVPATLTAEVDSTVTAEDYAFDLFDSDSNTGYIYDRPNANNISSLVVSETETNTLKLYFVPVVINPIVPYIQYSVRWETESGILLPVSLKNPNPESRLGESGSIVGLTESDIASIEGVEPLSYSEDITLTEGENNALSVVFSDSILPDEPEIESEVETYSLNTLDLASTFSVESTIVPGGEGTVYILNQDFLNDTQQVQFFIGDIWDYGKQDSFFGICTRSIREPKESPAFLSTWSANWSPWEQIYPSTGGGVSEVTPDTFTGILPVEKGGTGSNNRNEIANNLGVKSLMGGTAIPVNSDLDNYKTVGNFYCPYNDSVKTLNNTPTDTAFILTVTYASGIDSHIGQSLVTITGKSFYRVWNRSQNSWSTWIMTYSTANPQPTLYVKELDLTADIYDRDTWYPCVSDISFFNAVLNKIIVYNFLNMNALNKPAWSTNVYGFSCFLEALIMPGGWGTASPNNSIVLSSHYKFVSDDKNPVGLSLLNNSGRAVIWLRGGGKYWVKNERDTKYGIKTENFTLSEQTVAPTTTPPGLNLLYSTIYANLEGTASKTRGIASNYISNGTDINTITENGWYHTAYNHGCINFPRSQAQEWGLYVYPCTGSVTSYKMQVATALYDGAMYIRIQTSNGWGEWRELLDSSNYLSKAESLTGGIEIPANADLNSYTTVGNYHCPTDISAGSLTNSPHNKAFVMQVFNPTGTAAYVAQKTRTYNTGVECYRVKSSSGGWGPWYTTYSTANLNPATTVSSLTDGTNTYKFGQDSGGVYIEIE